MSKTPTEIMNESFGYVKYLRKTCELCNGKLERKSLYSDVVMHNKYNPETGRKDGKVFFIDTITDRFKDDHNYLLWCENCNLTKEVIITKKKVGKKRYIQVIQVI